MNNKKGIPIILIVIVLTAVFLAIFIGFRISNNKKEKLDENLTKQSNQIADNISTKFEVKDVKCKKGDEITIQINLLNDSDFVAANFEYIYDGNNLEYISYQEGESLANAAMTMVNNDDTNKKVLIGFVANPEDDTKTIKSGEIVNLKFKVKDNASANNIKNTFECTTLKQEDGIDVKYKINQGQIEVE